MSVKSNLCCILLCLTASLYTSGRVKQQLIIGRTTGSITLDSGDPLRVSGFARSLSEQQELHPVIEFMVGDSIKLDLWNVSQGDPHDIKINGVDLQKEDQQLAINADKGIPHMEHGFYSFVARSPGTYIYYCPINYPFDLQAGMFGILIIKPQQNDKVSDDQISQERLWYGYEIDTTWHTDAMMDTERGEKSNMTEYLPYHPQYFLINGKTGRQLQDTSIMLIAKEGTSTLIRLANTGMTNQFVTFPKELQVHVRTTKTLLPAADDSLNTILLSPLETCDVVVKCNTVYNGFVTYGFKSDKQNIPLKMLEIPVSITK